MIQALHLTQRRKERKGRKGIQVQESMEKPLSTHMGCRDFRARIANNHAVTYSPLRFFASFAPSAPLRWV
jgi:hypothetical protein